MSVSYFYNLHFKLLIIFQEIKIWRINASLRAAISSLFAFQPALMLLARSFALPITTAARSIVLATFSAQTAAKAATMRFAKITAVLTKIWPTSAKELARLSLEFVFQLARIRVARKAVLTVTTTARSIVLATFSVRMDAKAATMIFVGTENAGQFQLFFSLVVLSSIFHLFLSFKIHFEKIPVKLWFLIFPTKK